MIRSLHSYACYYFLLCLLHQQQQAASLTIIIDGATTNEWATRDEYQRLVEASGGNGQRQQQQQHRDQLTGANQYQAPGSQQPDEEDEQQQMEAEGRGASISAAEELESSLDRLDLIEAQQMKLKQLERQQQLLQPQQRHSPNNIINNQHYHHLQQQQQQQLRPSSGGARTLNELVPIGDEDTDEDPRHSLDRRESAPQKYCGSKLMDVLELVCQGRFYGGDYETQIVNPTIKSKRFIESLTGENVDHRQLPVGQQAAALDKGIIDQQLAAQQLEQHQAVEPVSRRRKLRKLASEYDGDNIRLTETDTNTNTNNNNDSNNHYLSYSKNNDQLIKQQLTNPINNNDNYQQPTNLNSNIRRNKHSRMYLYRRIRGASAECCERACYLDELRPYCKT